MSYLQDGVNSSLWDAYQSHRLYHPLPQRHDELVDGLTVEKMRIVEGVRWAQA